MQLLGADVCATRCSSSSTCGPNADCLPTTALDGTPEKICVSRSGVCGAPAGCNPACGPGTSCDLVTGTCVSNADAGPRDAGSGTQVDAGLPVGTVGPDGGVVNHLYFAVVGDTRPSLPNNTSGYPTSVINGIFEAIEAMNPRPQFVVATGDYQFATSGSSEAPKQVALYMAARAKYSGPLFPAMGNHECTSATDTNCPAVTTEPYKAFMASMIQPLGRSTPYYSFDVNAPAGQWSAKFVVTACNAWDATQKAWLAGELARPTTLTFVVRHMAQGVSAPCTSEMDPMVAAAPFSMFLAGHSHTFTHTGNQIIEGTGGAPLTGSAPHGYATIEQLPDNSLRVTQYDSANRTVVESYTVP